MPKPSDFFIGLVDFIAVILPGAILGFLLLLLDWPDRVKDVLAERLADPVAGWAAFLTTAYVLGHVLHHFGTFLDQPVYDWMFASWRRQELGWMINPCAWLKWIDSLITAALPGTTNSPSERKLFDPVGPQTKMHERAAWWAKTQSGPKADAPAGADAPPVFQPKVENTYGWADTYVRLRNPEVAAELDRAGVDSKFFRSLFFVTPFLVWVIDNRLYAGPTATGLTAVALLLGVFSLYRFCDRRWAAAEQTYRYFILLCLAEADARGKAEGEKVAPPGAPANPFTVRVEGGVPVRPG